MIALAGSIFILAGSAFILLAAFGALRLPDLFMRTHAITKAGTAGIGFLMLAVICFNHEMSIVTRALGVLFFISLTAPVSAHLISRAAYKYGVELWDRTFIDQVREYYKTGHVDPDSHKKPPA